MEWLTSIRTAIDYMMLVTKVRSSSSYSVSMLCEKDVQKQKR